MVEFIDAVSTALLKRLQHFASTIDVDPISIAQIRKARENTPVEMIGLVFDIRTTKKGHLILEIEDVTGVCKVLINKNSIYREQANALVKDMVVGVCGKVGEGIVFLNTLHMPSILSPKKIVKRDVKILFVGKECPIQEIVKKEKVTDVVFLHKNLYKKTPARQYVLSNGKVFPNTIDDIQGAEVLQNPCCVQIGKVSATLCSCGQNLNHVLSSGILTGAYGETQMLARYDDSFVLDKKTELLVVHGHDFLEKKEVGTICVSCGADNFIVDMSAYKVTLL